MARRVSAKTAAVYRRFRGRQATAAYLAKKGWTTDPETGERRADARRWARVLAIHARQYVAESAVEPFRAVSPVRRVGVVSPDGQTEYFFRSRFPTTRDTEGGRRLMRIDEVLADDRAYYAASALQEIAEEYERQRGGLPWRAVAPRGLRVQFVLQFYPPPGDAPESDTESDDPALAAQGVRQSQCTARREWTEAGISAAKNVGKGGLVGELESYLYQFAENHPGAEVYALDVHVWCRP